MGQRIAYSPEEDNKIFEMRKNGAKFKEIAAALGRSEKALYSHFNKIRSKPRVKHLRKNKVGVAVKMIATQNQEAAKSRPMFALVGERAEIAQTLRELFS